MIVELTNNSFENLSLWSLDQNGRQARIAKCFPYVGPKQSDEFISLVRTSLDMGEVLYNSDNDIVINGMEFGFTDVVRELAEEPAKFGTAAIGSFKSSDDSVNVNLTQLINDEGEETIISKQLDKGFYRGELASSISRHMPMIEVQIYFEWEYPDYQDQIDEIHKDDDINEFGALFFISENQNKKQVNKVGVSINTSTDIVCTNTLKKKTKIIKRTIYLPALYYANISDEDPDNLINYSFSAISDSSKWTYVGKSLNGKDIPSTEYGFFTYQDAKKHPDNIIEIHIKKRWDGYDSGWGIIPVKVKFDGNRVYTHTYENSTSNKCQENRMSGIQGDDNYHRWEWFYQGNGFKNSIGLWEAALEFTSLYKEKIQGKRCSYIILIPRCETKEITFFPFLTLVTVDIDGNIVKKTYQFEVSRPASNGKDYDRLHDGAIDRRQSYRVGEEAIVAQDHIPIKFPYILNNRERSESQIELDKFDTKYKTPRTAGNVGCDFGEGVFRIGDNMGGNYLWGNKDSPVYTGKEELLMPYGVFNATSGWRDDDEYDEILGVNRQFYGLNEEMVKKNNQTYITGLNNYRYWTNCRDTQQLEILFSHFNCKKEKTDFFIDNFFIYIIDDIRIGLVNTGVPADKEQRESDDKYAKKVKEIVLYYYKMKEIINDTIILSYQDQFHNAETDLYVQNQGGSQYKQTMDIRYDEELINQYTYVTPYQFGSGFNIIWYGYWKKESLPLLKTSTPIRINKNIFDSMIFYSPEVYSTLYDNSGKLIYNKLPLNLEGGDT